MNWYKLAYDSQTGYLKDFLRKGFDPYDYEYYVMEYLDAIGVEYNGADEYEIGDWWLGKATPDEIEGFRKWVENNIIGRRERSDIDNPAYETMEYKKYIKPTWLIHFTDNPWSIKKSGFTQGHDEFRGIHLTTWFDKKTKKPGYNFAFRANNNRDIKTCLQARKYGKHAVIFWGSGVEVYHYGDEESQVVIWGPSARKDMIFPIVQDDNTGGWVIESSDNRKLFENQDFLKVANWVEQNWRMLQQIENKDFHTKRNYSRIQKTKNNRKTASPLSPDSWQMHENTHRLPSDHHSITTPYGRFHQQSRPQDQLKNDYEGVHTTQDLQLAAVYANSAASADEDIPVIIQITTSKGWENDIDANNAMGAEFYGIIDSLQDLNIQQRMKGKFNLENVIELMEEIQNIDYFTEGEASDDPDELIAREARNNHPRVVVDFFDYYYGDKAPIAFYNKFVLPVYFKRGQIDNRIGAFLMSQMRFMQEIQDEEITAIYTFQKYDSNNLKSDFMDDEDEEQEDNDEEETPKLRQLSYENIINGWLDINKVWEKPHSPLIPEVYDTYYHGTTLNRAKQALPEMVNILSRIG